MKSLFLKLEMICILLASCLSSVFAQGVLTIEISDTLNAPIVGLEVKVVNKGGDEKIYKTDVNGRVIDSECPVGKYTYSFDYGDYNTGSFEITSGEYTWVNLDYRRVSINFTDSKGTPQKGNNVKFYIRDDSDNKTLIAERESDESGRALFIVPEGKYTYSTSKGDKDIEVKDDNINTNVDVSGALITHQTHFQFTCDGELIEVKGSHVKVAVVTQTGNKDFGVAAFDYTHSLNTRWEEPWTKTEGFVSLPAGEYEYEVYTTKYAYVKGRFTIDDKMPIMDNYIDIDLTKYIICEDGKEKNIVESDPKKPEFNLKVKVVNCEDETEPLQYVQTRYILRKRGVSEFALTNEDGIATFKVNEGEYHVAIPGDTIKNLMITSDTTVTMCLYKGVGIKKKYHEIYFKFRYNGEEVFPQNPEFISTGGLKIAPTLDEESGLKKFTSPIFLVDGEYSYWVNINEYGEETVRGSYNTSDLGKIDTVYINLYGKPNVTFKIIDKDSALIVCDYHLEYSGAGSKGFTTMTVTDGERLTTIEKGTYDIMCAGIMKKNVTISNDTTIYFEINNGRYVYAKFLHDGKIEYPDVYSITIEKVVDGKNYFASQWRANYSKEESKYKFSEPIYLDSGLYKFQYDSKNYSITANDYTTKDPRIIHISDFSSSDTTIYLVLPSKRTVNIHITDGNGLDVQGVSAKIYKYVDGVLDTTRTNYDLDYHGNLKSDKTGVIKDQLMPGRYQLRILDIKRDFIVSEYNLQFALLSDAESRNVTFRVLNKEDKTPISGVDIEVYKNNLCFTNVETGKSGEVGFVCELGDYTYYASYGDGIKGTFSLTHDTIIDILVDPQILTSELTLSGKKCINNGSHTLIVATPTPENTSIKGCTFSIDSEILASISSDGLLTAANNDEHGEVIVTAVAKDGSGIVGTYPVSIGNCTSEEPEEKYMVEKIILYYEECVKAGSSTMISAKVLPSYADNKDIKFSVNDNTLAFINYQGMLSAKADKFGIVTVTAESTDGSNISSTATINIGCGDQILVNLIELSAEKECIDLGESMNISASIYPEDASIKDVVFSVDDETLATISADGKLTANPENKGDVTITAKATDGSNVSKTVTVKIGGCEGEIIPQPEPVLVSNITLAVTDCINNSESTQISATVAPDDATSKEIVFSVDDETLATISADGKLTANPENKGDVTITAKATDGSNVSKSVTVKIGGCEGEIIPQPENILITNIALNAHECLKENEQTQIIATIFPENATNKNLVYSIDDESLATISSTGLLSVTSNGKKGVVTVTVKATDGSDIESTIDINIGGCELGKYVHIEFENGTASSTVDYKDTVTIRITTNNLIEKDILFVLVSGTDENMRVGNPVLATQLNCYDYYDESEMICGFHTQEISFVIDSKEDNQYFLVSAFEKFENGYSYYNYVNSNIIKLEVIKPDSIIDNTEIPTVFTPTEIDGANDDFMPGYPVVIYNRVGDVICVSSNGWDGTYKGKLADAGVYIYVITMKDGSEKRGTIQLYKE
ncbi:MAG: Ig-like domain-containing protein [Bacteroidales bacterium]|nr:Ig-like domain-containing protein [Candidatus Scybalocola fimicaballi]